MCGELDLLHIVGYRSPVALCHLEADSVTLHQSPEPPHVNGGVVNKKIATAFLLNEAITLPGIKPLHDTFRQITTSSCWDFPWWSPAVIETAKTPFL